MKRTALVVAIVLLASVVRGQDVEHKQSKLVTSIPYALLVAGQAADVVTTRGALSRGCVEGNVNTFGPQPSTGKLVGQKAMVLAPVVLLMAVADKHGHHAPSWISTGIISGLAFNAAAHNLQCGR